MSAADAASVYLVVDVVGGGSIVLVFTAGHVLRSAYFPEEVPWIPPLFQL